MSEKCNFTSVIDKIDVKWDNIPDWINENKIKELAKKYLENEINKAWWINKLDYRIRDLILKIEELLNRQDIERLNLESEFKKVKDEVIWYSKSRTSEMWINRNIFEENNKLAEISYTELEIDNKWNLLPKDKQIKNKENEIKKLKNEYLKMTFNRWDQLEKIKILENDIKLLENVDNILEYTNDKKSWYSAMLIENNWNLTYSIRWTEFDKISWIITDGWEDIDIFMKELNSTNFIDAFKKWKWLEYLFERKLWNIIEVFRLFFWWWKSQVQSMLEDYRNICTKYPWKDINIVWHSLGWWLAQILSMMDVCKNTYTYNAPWMVNIIKNWDILCKCFEDNWEKIDNSCLNKCIVCIWWKKDLAREPIYNVTWDLLSSKMMKDHIWKNIDIRINKNEYLEHWIKENRENIKKAPESIFKFWKEKVKINEWTNKNNNIIN